MQSNDEPFWRSYTTSDGAQLLFHIQLSPTGRKEFVVMCSVYSAAGGQGYSMGSKKVSPALDTLLTAIWQSGMLTQAHVLDIVDNGKKVDGYHLEYKGAYIPLQDRQPLSFALAAAHLAGINQKESDKIYDEFRESNNSQQYH